MIRCHGVLAGHAAARAEVVSGPSSAETKPAVPVSLSREKPPSRCPCGGQVERTGELLVRVWGSPEVASEPPRNYRFEVTVLASLNGGFAVYSAIIENSDGCILGADVEVSENTFADNVG